MTTKGVNLVGSLALNLLVGIGFLITYLRAPDKDLTQVYLWLAVVVLSIALVRILRNAIRIMKENTDTRASHRTEDASRKRNLTR